MMTARLDPHICEIYAMLSLLHLAYVNSIHNVLYYRKLCYIALLMNHIVIHITFLRRKTKHNKVFFTTFVLLLYSVNLNKAINCRNANFECIFY